MKRYLTFLITTCISVNFCFAQKVFQSQVDSLRNELIKAKEDTNKVNLLNQLGFESGTVKFSEARQYLTESIRLATTIGFKKGMADALSNLSLVYELQGDYFESLNLQIRSLRIREEIGDSLGVSFSIHYIGDIYFSQGELTEKASTKKDYNEKALENYFKSLKISEVIHNNNSTANNFNCIGNAYREENQYSKALAYYLRAVKLREEEGNRRRLAQTFGNVGKLYLEKSTYDSALFYLSKSLKLCEETGYTRTHVKTLGTMGNVYLEQKNYPKALEYCNRSLSASKEIGFLEFIAKANHSLSRIYSAQGFNGHNADKALAYYKQYIIERDSVNSKNANQAELQFDFDKKEALAKAEQEKKDVIVEVERKKQKLVILFVVLGLIFSLVFAGFIFRSLWIRNKQNKIISEQKHLVEEKQKEILSSIEYALRIQTAILPPKKIVKQYLKNSFVLYKPKDIVAGDFYWLEVRGDDIFFAACDCTGHGVPGALVSVVCNNALNRAVREFGLTNPSEILDKTTEIVVENFSRSEESIKDGMDISLCCFNFRNNTLQWAGANNPLWISRNGVMTEIKGDKQPIGMHENRKPFTTHEFILVKNEIFYFFTDGFADQFGGENGQKKLTRKRFKELLHAIGDKSMNEQGLALDKFISDYRKNVEQVDDILVIGVKV